MSKKPLTVDGYCQATLQNFTLREGARIKLMPHTDNWMRGAQYGNIKFILRDGTVAVILDKLPGTHRYQVDDMRPVDFK